MTVFTITSDKIRVTDPCYDKETWCSGVLENVLPGKWIAEKVIASDKDTIGWGDRIAELCVWHSDYIGNVDAHELTDIDVGVDSGQAGFFDESLYPEGETGEYLNLDTFYGKVCNGTKGEYHITEERMYNDEFLEDFTTSLKQTPKWEEEKEKYESVLKDMRTKMRYRSEPDYLGIANVGFGVATHSGYGDGGYNCYVGRNAQGQIVAAKIVFIDDESEETSDLV